MNWFRNVFNKIRHKLGSAAHSVGRIIHKIPIKSAIHTVGRAVSTVYKDTKGAISYVATRPTYYFDQVKDSYDKTVTKTTDTAKSLGSSLSLPLVAGVGVAGLVGYAVLKK